MPPALECGQEGPRPKNRTEQISSVWLPFLVFKPFSLCLERLCPLRKAPLLNNNLFCLTECGHAGGPARLAGALESLPEAEARGSLCPSQGRLHSAFPHREHLSDLLRCYCIPCGPVLETSLHSKACLGPHPPEWNVARGGNPTTQAELRVLPGRGLVREGFHGLPA